MKSTDFSLKSYSRYKFGEDDQKFCFCRVIKDRAGAGVLIEIFDYIGGLDSSVESITNSSRVIDPVHIVGEGIKKKRWRKIGESIDYDMEVDSGYSKIKFIMGRGNDRRVWCNGEKYPLDFESAESIENHTLWTAAQLENRLIKELPQSKAANGKLE